MNAGRVSERTLALDLDGTLLDCGPRQVEALHAVLGEPYPDPTGFWQAKRGGATTLEALVALGMAEQQAAEIAAQWRITVEDDDLLAVDTLLPAVEQTLAAARTSVDRLVIITARRRGDAAVAQCERLGLMTLLDEVIAVDPTAASESKAAVLTDIAAFAFIGDTASDARAAAAAGVPFAAVTTGQHAREVLLAAIDTPILASLDEAINHLLREHG